MVTDSLSLLTIFSQAATHVPAYGAYLSGLGIDKEIIASILATSALERIPTTDKVNYISRYHLHERSRGGDLFVNDLVCFSSGTTGQPTSWARSIHDDAAQAQVFRRILSDNMRLTRAVACVCFPMGAWVGGTHALACLRTLRSDAFRCIVVTPGNNYSEINRVLSALEHIDAPIVLLGYPPFIRDILIEARSESTSWSQHQLRAIVAGEAISEPARDAILRLLNCDQPEYVTSIYGTADAGVVGYETANTITIRRMLASRADICRQAFPDSDLPMLFAYDPRLICVEELRSRLCLSTWSSSPLVRYDIGDYGQVLPMERLLRFLESQERPATETPIIALFGRGREAVSFYGANVFAQTISEAIEPLADVAHMTGRFHVETRSAADIPELVVHIELHKGTDPGGGGDVVSLLAEAIRATLRSRSSEFCHYVPEAQQRPRVVLCHHGQKPYFARVGKQNYIS